LNILVFNQDWFVEEWKSLGHRVITAGHSSYYDVHLETFFLDIQSILEVLPQDFKPDWIVFHDNSCPLSICGLTTCQIPLAFYSVDTHHHCFLHSYLADTFDLIFVAQCDFLTYFYDRRARIEWLPLWASRNIEPQKTKKHDAIFVGTMNPGLNPERVLFFEELQKIATIEVLQGDYALFFPFSETVINQTVRGDLNFRVFESMRCGPLLLTEQSGNGLTSLFVPDEELLLYSKGNYVEVAQILSTISLNKERFRLIAENGHKKVLAQHCAIHRAAKVMEAFLSFNGTCSGRTSIGPMMNFAVWSSNAGVEGGMHSVAGFASAMQALMRILEQNEQLNDESAFFAVMACLGFDKLTFRTSGRQMIGVLADKFPHLRTLGMGQVALLAKGAERAVAEELAEIIGLPDLTFLDKIFPLY
jgi:hypothetical protein